MNKGKKRSGWRKLGRALLFIFGSIILLLIVLIIYVVSVGHINPPDIADKSALKLERQPLNATGSVRVTAGCMKCI